MAETSRIAAVPTAWVAVVSRFLADRGRDRTQVARMMAALGSRGPDKALVFATHDVELAELHATRIIRLDAGRIIHGEEA